jgi:hypothetical protein
VIGFKFKTKNLGNFFAKHPKPQNQKKKMSGISIGGEIRVL